MKKFSEELKVNSVGATIGCPHFEGNSKEKGITLVALIITIIIMLILVEVSVLIVINSDLLGTAENAGDKTKTAYEEEGNMSEITVGDKTYANIEDYRAGKEKLPERAGKRYDTTEEYSDGINTAVIPEGFTVSGIANETKIDGGLVIYDIPETVDTTAENFWTETVTIGDQTYPKVQTLYNQFVWIPVEEAYITAKEITDMINSTDAEYASVTSNQTAINYLASKGRYPMAVQLDNGEDYRGILYKFAAGEDGVVITSYVNFSILSTDDYTTVTYAREPAYLTNSSYADGKFGATYRISQASLQDEYNTMVEKVEANGGFYVARYELTGNSTDGYGSKRGQAVTSASTANMWYGLYSACKGMYNKTTDKVQSTMISGAQWNQIMIWMKDVTNTYTNSSNETVNTYYVIDSSHKGNYTTVRGGTGKKQVSGYLDNYSVNKVFDLGGNLYDWTTMAYNNNYRGHWGGLYRDGASYVPASGGSVGSPHGAISDYSARCALYVK